MEAGRVGATLPGRLGQIYGSEAKFYRHSVFVFGKGKAIIIVTI
jgi:hypothetical protein